MKLRPYQQTAHDAAVRYMGLSTDPFCIVAATGAGKSLIIAALADTIHAKTGKRILCLAPSAELVVQNAEKFLATGSPASIYSASAGGRCLRHKVVFASPLTVKNRISAFQKHGDNGYALIVLDECHQITPTIKGIIEAIRMANPNVRVCGLTATPYRLGGGYIFAKWPDGKANGEKSCRTPYFTQCVDEIGARALIDMGYLTPPVIGKINADGYDTGGLVANRMGNFDAAAVDQAYHGHGRKTAAIVADIVAQSRNRAGVLIFAATVQHAYEVMASLPPEYSAIVTGETPRRERVRMLRDFKARKLKYMVNVSVLTVGFDAPHVDVVAILRKTESVGLLQQIVGRGLRLDGGKDDCLVLDYTTNLDDHCPDGDLFSPVIRAGAPPKEGGDVEVICPECGTINEVSMNGEYEDYEHDEAGYILDLEGEQVQSEHGPIAMHYGRRCMGLTPVGAQGKHERCDYRWTSKECPHCEAPNDIAARYCAECKGEIVDPNEKLHADFKALKRDPTKPQTDDVVRMECVPGVSRAGNKTMRVEFVTKWRQFTIWLMPDGTHTRAMRDWRMFADATNDGEASPRTVSYSKDAESGFFRVLGYDRAPDMEPET